MFHQIDINYTLSLPFPQTECLGINIWLMKSTKHQGCQNSIEYMITKSLYTKEKAIVDYLLHHFGGNLARASWSTLQGQHQKWKNRDLAMFKVLNFNLTICFTLLFMIHGVDVRKWTAMMWDIQSIGWCWELETWHDPGLFRCCRRSKWISE